MASDCRKIRGQSIRRGMLGSFSIVLLLLLLVLNATPSNATISFIDSGRTYPSKPDPLLGQPLLRGFDYMGRLQYVSENPTLCPGMYPNQRFQIKTPSDGLPVALVARSGGCSIYEKLKVASSLIIPSNTVGYLIVQDSSKRHHKDFLEEDADVHDSRSQTVNTMTEDDPWRAGEKDSFFSSPQLLYYEDEDEDEDEETESYVLPLKDSSDWKVAESNGRKLLESPTTPNRRLLQLKHEYFTGVGDESLGDVNMAVLHVSPTTGQALFHYLASEPQQNRHQGGTRILLNGKENSFASRTLVVWMLITFSGCACFCACLLLCMQTTFEEEPEAQAPPRPRRRRLTFEEVRSRFPSYTFHNGCVSCETEPPDHGGYMQLSDECTICLDEFHPGDRVRKLPCDHVFHSTCIAKWLVERHATCPLCKLDLYIEPEDDDDSSSSDTPPEAPSGGLGHWLQNTFFSGASGYTPLVIPSGSPDEAALLESTSNTTNNDTTEGDEPRSWWPFSVETAPSTAEEEETQHDGGVRSSPLSDAAGVLSSWARSVVGRRRHHRLVASSSNGSNDNEAANRLTELTEPLVPQMELQVSPSSSTSSSSSSATDTIHNTTTTTTTTTTTEI